MAKRKGRSLVNGEQTVIDELAPEKIPEIHTAAVKYAKIRDQRSALSKEEKEARDHLTEVMERHDRTNYEYGDLVVTVNTKKKAVVTSKDEAEKNGNGDDEE